MLSKYKIHVRHSIPDSTYEYLNKVAPFYVELVRAPSLGIHEHPIGHYTRAIAECVAIRFLAQRSVVGVLDVGGNPSRTRKTAEAYGLAYRCLAPDLDDRDVVRRLIRNVDRSDVVCQHKIAECHCGPGFTSLAVHSAYYLSPQEIADAVRSSSSGLFVAVVHVFDKISGQLCQGESSYTITGDTVCMSTAGNFKPYVHSSMPWLVVGAARVKQGTLVWELLGKVGDQQIFVFGLSGNTELPISSILNPEYGHAIDPQDLRGIRNVQERMELTPSTEEYEAGYVTSYGVVLMGTHSIVLPSELLSEARVYIAGKERTRHNYTALITYLKSKVGRLNIPHASQAPVIIQCATIGFMKDIDTEAIIQAQVSKYGDKLVALQRWPVDSPANTALEGLTTKFSYFVGLYGVYAVFKYIRQMRLTHRPPRLWPGEIMAFVRSRGWHYVLPALVMVSFPMLVQLLSAMLDRYKRPFKFEQNSLSVNKFTSDPDYVRKLSPQVGAITQYPRDWDANPKFVPSSVPFLTVDNRIPPRCANDCATQIHGLIQRMLGGVEHADWSGVSRDLPQWVFPGQEKLEPSDFEVWLKEEFGRRNEPQRVNKILQAYQEIQLDPNKIEFVLSPFIKDEAYVTKTTAVKPRMIFSPSDHYLAATGPICYAMTKRLKELWNAKEQIYYTSGATQVDLGAYFSESIALYGEDCIIIETDFSEFESRVTVEARNFVMDLWERKAAVDKYLLDLLRMQNRQRGATREGLKWQREGGMSSGVGDTSVTNSIINACSHAAFLSSVGISEYRMMVLGDDNLLMLPNNRSNMESLQGLKSYMEGLGMKPETINRTLTPFQAEYCSGWFPTVTTNDLSSGVVGHVWVPKVGRVAAKTFMVKQEHAESGLGPSILKGTAIGFLNGTVDPILQTVARLTCEAMGEVEPTDNQVTEFQPMMVDSGYLVTNESVCQRYGMTVEELGTLIVRLTLLFATQTQAVGRVNIPTIDRQWKSVMERDVPDWNVIAEVDMRNHLDPKLNNTHDGPKDSVVPQMMPSENGRPNRHMPSQTQIDLMCRTPKVYRGRGRTQRGAIPTKGRRTERSASGRPP